MELAGLNGSELLTVVGLFFDMVGVGLIWWYGVPKAVGYSDKMQRWEDSQRTIGGPSREDTIERRGRAGLLLVMLGFLLQLVATLL